MKLTTRSRIGVRWTTDPEMMGYGNSPAPERLAGKCDYVGSPRSALAYAYNVRQNVGMSTHIRIEFEHRGNIVRRDMLEQVEYEAEWTAEQNGKTRRPLSADAAKA